VSPPSRAQPTRSEPPLRPTSETATAQTSPAAAIGATSPASGTADRPALTVTAARAAGIRRAVVSSSTNCGEVLESTGLAWLMQARVDGLTVQQLGLPGKPAPDAFLEAARRLDVAPAQAAVFEDALAGVAAAKEGGFGFVVGVDRADQGAALLAHGADIVVTDLGDLLIRQEAVA